MRGSEAFHDYTLLCIFFCCINGSDQSDPDFPAEAFQPFIFIFSDNIRLDQQKKSVTGFVGFF